MQRAVIDRFEGPVAVLLVDGRPTPLDVPRAALPPDAHEGHWLQIELVDDTLVAAALDQPATDAARQRIADKLARLRRGDHLQD